MDPGSRTGSRAGKEASLDWHSHILLALLAVGLMMVADVPSILATAVGAPFDNARLERLRGLTFERPVPVVAMNPEEARQIFERDLMRDYSDEHLRADSVAGSMAHLVNYRGNAVLCVIGDGLRQHAELPAEVWRQTTMSSADGARF
jgi:hypothetical protein